MQQENLLVKENHRRNTGEPAGRRWRCTRRSEFHTGGEVLILSLPPSLSYHSLEAQGEAVRGRDSDARLAVWRHKERQRRHKEKQRRQLEAAGVPAAEARQPEAAGEARQGDEVESAGAEEEDQPPAHHKV